MTRTIGELFPAFEKELAASITAQGRKDLAEDIGSLAVLDRCRCGETWCAHFYTAPRPEGAYGPGLVSMHLEALEGTIVLDVVDDRIMGIEVLDRADLKAVLDEYLP
jgi:hypothetical protein